MTKTKQEAAEDLKRWIPEGSTVYTICRRAAASGMSAVYSLVVFTPQGDLHPNYAAHILTGRTMKEVRGYSGIVVRGCGYDRPGTLVGELAHALYGSEKALKHRAL